jgi:hypothetical protein
MDNIIFRERPNEHNECDQWTLVKDTHDDEAYVVQEHVVLDAILSGKPYLRLIRRMTVKEFLQTEQPAAVKRELQAMRDERNGPSP